MQVKEIKLRPATDVGDYQVKLRAILKFLEEGNKVKITLRFRGREMAHQQLGLAQLQKLKLMLLSLGLWNKHLKWKAVKWVCYLDLKRKVILKKHCKSSAFYILIIMKR